MYNISTYLINKFNKFKAVLNQYRYYNYLLKHTVPTFESCVPARTCTIVSINSSNVLWPKFT